MHQNHEIVILGPANTGKTQLVNRLRGQPFNSTYRSTIAIKLLKLVLSEQQRTIIYRDMAADTLMEGDVTTVQLVNKEIQYAREIYIVFDVNKEDGFEKLKRYIQDLDFPSTAKITLIGTHADLGIKTTVDNAAKAYAFEKKLDYLTISLNMANPKSIQELRDKSCSLESAPIKRQSSVSGSVYSGDSGGGHVAFSKKALEAHNARFSNRPVGEGSYYDSEEEMTGNRPPAPASCCSFALRMAGMAMILAALIGLIYIALAVVNIISAAALISLMNNIVVGVGSLLGASAATSLMTISQVGASLNVSTTAVAGMFMTVPSLVLLVAGYGAFRAGSQKPDQNPESNPDYSLSKRG